MSMKYETVVSLVNKILNEYEEATVRQIYYRMVSPPYQYMANNRSMYCSFDEMLTRARVEGLVDWRKLVDHSRTSVEPPYNYSGVVDFMGSLKNYLNRASNSYHKDLWKNQSYNIKIFVEKDALTSIIADIALDYQVSVITGRGYNSFSQLKRESLKLAESVNEVVILYFGDFDPSGMDIDRSLGARLREYSGIDLSIIRVALDENDIINLPFNPTKPADKRTPDYLVKYGDKCWELDALPPNELKERVEKAINEYIDDKRWNVDINDMEHDRVIITERIKELMK